MNSHESAAFFLRMLTALGGALKRGMLGKSANSNMKQFTGGKEYWDRVIAAQLGWPQKQPPPDRSPSRSSVGLPTRAIESLAKREGRRAVKG